MTLENGCRIAVVSCVEAEKRGEKRQENAADAALRIMVPAQLKLN